MRFKSIPVKLYGRKDIKQYLPRPWYIDWLYKIGILKRKPLLISVPPNTFYTNNKNLPKIKKELSAQNIDWVDCTKPEFTVIDRDDEEV